MAEPDFPPLPEIPFIGKRRSRELNRAYEAARRAYRVEHPIVPAVPRGEGDERSAGS
jgi:hypothetical protein